MPIRTSFITKQNFTGRKKIKQKPDLISVRILDRAPEEARIEVRWDEDAVIRESRINDQIKRKLALDVMFLGNTERFELETGRTHDQFVVPECPQDAQMDFRLKVVSVDAEDNGLLLAASTSIRLETGPGEEGGGTVSSGFFNFRLSDNLNGRIWEVTWPEPDNPTIFIDRGYFSRFREKPVFPAHVFPEILRSVVTGILFRLEDLEQVSEGSASDDWLKFIEQKLSFPLRGEDAPELDDPTAKLNVVEKIVEIFAAKHWRGDKTLLEEFV